MADDERSIDGDRARGLYTGFEGYLTPSADDYRAVMTQGLVALDTNALLNVYRYTANVRKDLLSVLHAVGPTLWIPNHVAWEFWRNRESAIRDFGATAAEFEAKVGEARRDAIEAVRALANRIGWSASHKKAFTDPIDESFANLSKEVGTAMGKHGESGELRRNTFEDKALLALEPLLRGRVGGPFDPATHEKAVKEAQRRIDNSEPPGYKDAKKGDRNAAGDYLVWSQLITQASATSRDALLVTGDVKPDWWRSWGGEKSAGPRYELVDEFAAKTGKRIFLLKPAEFFEKAASVFSLRLGEESIAQARRIDESATRHRSPWDYDTAVIAAVERVASAAGLPLGGRYRKNRIELDYVFTPDNPKSAIEVRVGPGRNRDSDANHFRRLGRNLRDENIRRVLIISSAPLDELNCILVRHETHGYVEMIVWNSMDDDPALARALSRLLRHEAQDDVSEA